MPVILLGLALALDVMGASSGLGAADQWQQMGVGVAFAITAGAVFGLALVWTQHETQGVDGRVRTIATMSLSGVVALAVMAGQGGPHWPQTTLGWGGLAALTFLYGTAFTIMFTVLPKLGVSGHSAIMNVEPVFALVLASPVVIWQAWAFVAAGLYPHERAVFFRYFPFMVGLMAAGVSFGYLVALPYSLGFLVRMMDPSQVLAIFSVGQFLTLEFALTAAMGLVFQLPLVMLALQKIGLVAHRTYVRNWRMIILVIFVVAAVVTPPDPASMVLMAIPMVLLYGLGLVLTWFGRRNDAAEAVA
jgi:Tat protein translocase TatC